MAEQVFTFGWNRFGETLSRPVTVTAEGSTDREVVVPASATNKEVALTLDVSQLKSCYLYSDVTVTVKTNSTAEPGDEFTLIGGIPTVWVNGSILENPFSADITGSVYLSNATQEEATVTMLFMEDPTP